MFEWTALLVPALISTALVFVASSLIHMVIRWHQPDYRKLPNEDEVRAVIRKGNPGAGQFVLPHCNSSKEMASPELAKKMEEGPVGIVWLRAPGPMKLGPFLGTWVVYSLIISLLVGTVGWMAVPRGAPYPTVFHVIGATAWLAYAWGGPSDSIWKGKPWISTFRGMVDGLVYASLTAGAFAWLWPR